MRARKLLLIGCAAAVAVLIFQTSVVVGEDQAPDKPRGVSVGATSSLDLVANLDSIDKRQLRVRAITFEPGGAVPLHSHKDRPGIATVIKGTLTEHVEGKGVFERREGDRLIEDKDTVHWAENLTNETVIVLATDLYKP